MIAAMPEIFVEFLVRALLMMPVNERPDVILVELLDIHQSRLGIARANSPLLSLLPRFALPW